MEIIKTQPGHLTILTGKTDMGKSTITVFDASEMIKERKKVIFFSYEYCQSIIFNKLTFHFNLKWADLFNTVVVDAAGWNLDNVINYIKVKKDLVDIVYIDYLDLLKNWTYGNKPVDRATEIKQIQTICKELADVAKEMNISIVLLSQTGSEETFEETVSQLNLFCEKVKPAETAIKMFIGKGSVIDSKIKFDDISHIILIDGYNLKHFSSLNLKEIYKD